MLPLFYNINVNKRHFSYSIFLICLLECLLWSIPMVEATGTEALFVLQKDLDFQNHILNEKDIYAETSLSSLKIQEASETIKLEGLKPEHNGKGTVDPLPKLNKWEILTWGVMTVLTLVFATSRGVSIINKSNSQDDSGPSNGGTCDADADASAESHADMLFIPSQPSTRELTASELKNMTDEAIIAEIDASRLMPYDLEDKLDDTTRAVALRRRLLGVEAPPMSMKLISDLSHNQLLTASARGSGFELTSIPFENYDYDQVTGENVIGYLPLPIGVAGPLLVNGKYYRIPMATTEGCLVASTHRGCKAISKSGGVDAIIVENGLTRGPLVRFPTADRASEFKSFIDSELGFKAVEKAFNATSPSKLKSVKVKVAGRNVYVRFKATPSDVKCTKQVNPGYESALAMLSKLYDMEVVAVGNCTEKKPSTAVWKEGSGRTVVADAVIKGEVIKSVLKTTVEALVAAKKNLLNSLASTVGGFNAHAANILTAIFLATGQDPAQNVESSNCSTILEATNDGKDLYMSVTMPSIQVGSVGNNISLPAQSACLGIVQCSAHEASGDKADHLAHLATASVMAAELSLLADMASGQLPKSQLLLQRAKIPTAAKL